MEKVEPIDPQWRLVQSVENVTPTGLTIVWNRDNAENIVDLVTGEGYNLEKKTSFGWRTAEWHISNMENNKFTDRYRGTRKVLYGI